MNLKRFLKTSILLALLICGGSQYAKADLVAHWNFDVATGSETVPDQSGNGFDLIVGEAGAVGSDGAAGNGYLANTAGSGAAKSGVVTVTPTTVNDLDGSLMEQAFLGSFTVEGFWRSNSSGLSDWSTLFGFGHSGSDGGSWVTFTVRGQGGFLAGNFGQFPTPWQYNGENLETAENPQPRDPFADGLWHHVALTFDGAGTRDFVLFVDGELKLNIPDITQLNEQYAAFRF